MDVTEPDSNHVDGGDDPADRPAAVGVLDRDPADGRGLGMSDYRIAG
jgi:hypothetical protein